MIKIIRFPCVRVCSVIPINLKKGWKYYPNGVQHDLVVTLMMNKITPSKCMVENFRHC